MTDREIVELVNQCGKRVCSTDEHHGCPFGDEGLVDCTIRLEAAYDEAIERLLELSDAQNEGRLTIRPYPAPPAEGTCGTCENFVRTRGTARGRCKLRMYARHRSGKEDPTRLFVPSQSRKACKDYVRSTKNKEETTC